MSYKQIATEGSSCPYCGHDVLFSRTSEFIYGKDYGAVYHCSRYPVCNAFVWCHKGSKRALGRLADRELREAKKAAHAEFDDIWKYKRKLGCRNARSLGYQWLSEQLGIPASETHIGMFDVKMCERVIRLCHPYASRIQSATRPYY